MNENLQGYFARSLAGHDKGDIFYIISEEDPYVFITDGRTRSVQKPKKKKKKHLQLIKQRRELSTDSDIRKAIKELKTYVQS